MDRRQAVETNVPVQRALRPRRNTRPRDSLGRPLPYGSEGIEGQPEGVVRSPQETLAEAQRLLDNDRPFHAHEVLEDAWKSAPDSEGQLWRGLAQLAVGITHVARRNFVGGARLIERGASNITPYADDPPYGLDIAAVLAWCANAVCVTTGDPTAPLSPPPLAPEPNPLSARGTMDSR